MFGVFLVPTHGENHDPIATSGIQHYGLPFCIFMALVVGSMMGLQTAVRVYYGRRRRRRRRR